LRFPAVHRAALEGAGAPGYLVAQGKAIMGKAAALEINQLDPACPVLGVDT